MIRVVFGMMAVLASGNEARVVAAKRGRRSDFEVQLPPVSSSSVLA